MKKYRFISITEEIAKANYCKGDDVYICNNERKFWKMPASREYGSHAPAEDLFYRSMPKYEGETKFFEKRLRRWACYYINSRGNQAQKTFDDMEDGLFFTKILDKRIEKKTCYGYDFMEI